MNLTTAIQCHSGDPSQDKKTIGWEEKQNSVHYLHNGMIGNPKKTIKKKRKNNKINRVRTNGFI